MITYAGEPGQAGWCGPAASSVSASDCSGPSGSPADDHKKSPTSWTSELQNQGQTKKTVQVREVWKKKFQKPDSDPSETRVIFHTHWGKTCVWRRPPASPSAAAASSAAAETPINKSSRVQNPLNIWVYRIFSLGHVFLWFLQTYH